MTRMKYLAPYRSTLLLVIISILSFTVELPAGTFPTQKIFYGKAKSSITSGKYLFVSAGGKIIISEIITAGNIIPITEITLPSIVSDMKVAGNYLYAADLLNGLYIYDCSTMSDPVIAGTYSSPYRAFGVTVNGSDVYVSWGKDGVSRIDVSIKENPQLLKHSTIQADKTHLFYGNLYCQTRNRLFVVHPITMDSITTIPTGTAYPHYEIKNVVYNDFMVAVVENYFGILGSSAGAVNASSTWGDVSFYDVSNISSPKRTKSFYINAIQAADAIDNILYCVTLDSLITYKIYENSYIKQVPVSLFNGISNMTMNDSLLFMTTDYPGYFQIAKHKNQNVVTTNYFLDTRALIGSVAATDSFIVAGTQSFEGLYYIDITPNGTAVVKQQYTLNTGFVRGLKLIRDTVYVATEKGFKIFTVANDSLSLISELDYGGIASEIDVTDRIAAVGGWYNVHLIDIADRTTPKVLSSIKHQYSDVVNDIRIQDSILFYTIRSSALFCYSIANPNAPESLWTKLVDDAVTFPYGNTLYVGSGKAILVFNISNIRSPIKIDSVKLPVNYEASRIHILDSVLFVAFSSLSGNYEVSGLLTYRISENGGITLHSTVFTPEYPTDIAMNSTDLFLSSGLDGIYLYPRTSLMTSVAGGSSVSLPQLFSLNQNYPNPFNPSTTIEFVLHKRSTASLTVYDVLGREITTLINGEVESGRSTVSFNASTVSSGVYFYRLTVDGQTQNKKMLLIK